MFKIELSLNGFSLIYSHLIEEEFTDEIERVDRLNARLEPNGFPPVSDLGTDFSDGTRLIQLIVRRFPLSASRSRAD